MRLPLLIFVVLLGFQSLGQRYNLGFGLKAGASNYLGEMGGEELTRRDFVADMKLMETKWTGGIFMRYRFNPLMAVRADLSYLRIEGADANSTNPARVGRNLNFRNDMFELSARFEMNVPWLSTPDVGGVGRYTTAFDTYVFAGFAGTYHNPKTLYGQDWVPLRPLMTEGKNYSPVALGMPYGMGFYFTFERNHRIGWEFNWRLMFSDYLDDVSNVYVDATEMGVDPRAFTLANRRDELSMAWLPNPNNYLPGNKRGDPTHNDNYMTIEISYSYLIRTKNSFHRSNYNWLYGKKGRYRTIKAKF